MTRSSSQELFHVDFRAERITCGRFRDYRARYTCNLKSPTCSTHIGTYMVRGLLLNGGEKLVTVVLCVMGV